MKEPQEPSPPQSGSITLFLSLSFVPGDLEWAPALHLPWAWGQLWCEVISAMIKLHCAEWVREQPFTLERVSQWDSHGPRWESKNLRVERGLEYQRIYHLYNTGTSKVPQLYLRHRTLNGPLQSLIPIFQCGNYKLISLLSTQPQRHHCSLPRAHILCVVAPFKTKFFEDRFICYSSLYSKLWAQDLTQEHRRGWTKQIPPKHPWLVIILPLFESSQKWGIHYFFIGRLPLWVSWLVGFFLL